MAKKYRKTKKTGSVIDVKTDRRVRGSNETKNPAAPSDRLTIRERRMLLAMARALTGKSRREWRWRLWSADRKLNMLRQWREKMAYVVKMDSEGPRSAH